MLTWQLMGCSVLPQFARQAAPTPTLVPFIAPLPTAAAPTVPLATATRIPTATAPPPSVTTVPSTLAATRPPASPTAILSGQFTRVKIFFIALNDNGHLGKRIGCGDSVVSVDRTVPRTNAPLRAAFNELLSFHDQYYGQSGLYNSLYQSRLTLGNATIVGGRATLQFTGTHALGGVCDNPRFEAQIKETALQFPTVSQVSAFINGIPLETIVSGR